MDVEKVDGNPTSLVNQNSVLNIRNHMTTSGVSQGQRPHGVEHIALAVCGASLL